MEKTKEESIFNLQIFLADQAGETMQVDGLKELEIWDQKFKEMYRQD